MYDFKKYGLTEPLIHIGFPKTLSTWMQSNLFRAENGLLQLMRPVEVQPVIVDPAPFNFKPKEVYAILDKK